MITIIDYNAGNLASVANALKRLGYDYVISSDKAEIAAASKIIFPGVGAAARAMASLKELDLIEVLRDCKVPFLGICLGMQILAEYSEEGETECLGIIDGQVRKFDGPMKVPQIGWNMVRSVDARSKSPLMQGVDDDYFYFVNSYYFSPAEDVVVGESLYGDYFAAVVQKDNFYATQFHPEKSGENGLKLLNNFCEL